jgi:hypothetical protein
MTLAIEIAQASIRQAGSASHAMVPVEVLNKMVRSASAVRALVVRLDRRHECPDCETVSPGLVDSHEPLCPIGQLLAASKPVFEDS